MASFKVCLIGDSGVGKTSLLHSFVFGRMPDRPGKTFVSDVRNHTVRIDARPGAAEDVHLVLWDIAGEAKLRDLLHEAFFQGAAGLIAVCDVTRPATVEALREWIDAARWECGEVPITIVGNKVDLPRVVAAKALETLCARTEGSLLYTSAKTGEGVRQLFEDMARRAWARAADGSGGTPALGHPS